MLLPSISACMLHGVIVLSTWRILHYNPNLFTWYKGRKKSAFSFSSVASHLPMSEGVSTCVWNIYNSAFFLFKLICILKFFPFPDMNSENLKTFSKLSYEEKKQIIRNGRPTCELRELKQQKGTKIIRTFQTNWYSRKEWLCGCAAKKKAFLFPMYAVFCI